MWLISKDMTRLFIFCVGGSTISHFLHGWILGGSRTGTSGMKMIKSLDNVGGQFFNSMSRFLKNSVIGSGLRFEAVVSGSTSSEVLYLMSTFGARMVNVCLMEGLIVGSTKDWPYYVDARVAQNLGRLKDLVTQAETINFNRTVSHSLVRLGFLFGFYIISNVF